MAAHIHGQGVGGFVAAAAVFFDGLHDDPIQIAGQHGAETERIAATLGGDAGELLAGEPAEVGGGRAGGQVLQGRRQDFAIGGNGHFLAGRGVAGEQFVQQDAEAVEIAAGIDVRPAGGLLRTHVGGGADGAAGAGGGGVGGRPPGGGFGDAEINHLGHQPSGLLADDDVGGFQIAVDDALLVGVLDGIANREKQLQPAAHAEAVVVAEIGDFLAIHQFHDEVRPAGGGGAGIEDAGDVRVVHAGEGLAFERKAGDDIFGVHAHADDFEGHLAMHRHPLLRQVNHTAAARAEAVDEVVGPDPRANAGMGGIGIRGLRHAVLGRGGDFRVDFEEFVSIAAHFEQFGQPFEAFRIVAAGVIEKSPLLRALGERGGGGEEQFVNRFVHRPFPCGSRGRAGPWHRPTGARWCVPRRRPWRRFPDW